MPVSNETLRKFYAIVDANKDKHVVRVIRHSTSELRYKIFDDPVQSAAFLNDGVTDERFATMELLR